MKSFICFVLSCFCLQALSARTLQLTLSDGTLVNYWLSSTNPPVMKHTSDGFTINADGYTFSQFASFRILTKDPTGIASTKEKASFTQLDNLLTVNGHSSVAVFDASGREVMNVKAADGASSVQISLSGLPKGIYLARAGKASFKFIKK